MKVLYAFQGTGNGHQARAIELVPLLQRMADVDVWVSGGGMDRSFDVAVDFPVCKIIDDTTSRAHKQNAQAKHDKNRKAWHSPFSRP